MFPLSDIHCHIVYGVDDGARSIDHSLALLSMQYEQGIRFVITTPHYRRGMFETPREAVIRHFNKVKELAAEKFPDLELYLGCELHSNMDLEEQCSNPNYRMAGSNFVLLEFSEMHDAEYIKEHTRQVIYAGYTPIIAHVERYPAARDLSLLHQLKQLGALLQINVSSLIGKDGWGTKRWCAKMCKEDLVSFIGTDAHNTSDRKPRMDEAAKHLIKKYGEDYARRLLWDNPQRIVRGA